MVQRRQQQRLYNRSRNYRYRSDDYRNSAHVHGYGAGIRTGKLGKSVCNADEIDGNSACQNVEQFLFGNNWPCHFPDYGAIPVWRSRSRKLADPAVRVKPVFDSGAGNRNSYFQRNEKPVYRHFDGVADFIFTVVPAVRISF